MARVRIPSLPALDAATDLHATDATSPHFKSLKSVVLLQVWKICCFCKLEVLVVGALVKRALLLEGLYKLGAPDFENC